MSIYIVTQCDIFYPQQGTIAGFFTSLDKAREVHDMLMKQPQASDKSWYIMRVPVDTSPTMVEFVW